MGSEAQTAAEGRNPVDGTPAPSGAVATTLPAYDVAAGKNVTVTPEDLTKRFMSGELRLLGNSDYNLVGPDGAVYNAGAKSVGSALQAGYRFATREEVANHDAQGAAAGARALVEGAAEAVPGGKAALVALGADPVDMRAREDAHPVARMTGLGIGLVGGTALLGAAELPALGTVLGGERLAAAATAALGESRAASTLGRMAVAAAGAVPEGVTYGVGNLANEASLGDANFSAEALLAHAGTGALLSAAVGGAAGAFGKRALDAALPAATREGAAALEARAGAGDTPEGWFGRERGASPKAKQPEVPPAEVAYALRDELQAGAKTYVPGEGWVSKAARHEAEGATAPAISTPGGLGHADTLPSAPPDMGVDTNARTLLKTRAGELEHPTPLAARADTLEGEVVDAGVGAPRQLPAGRDVFDHVAANPAARDIVATGGRDSLNLSGAFGDMESGAAGAVRGGNGLANDFAAGAQRYVPNLDELTPEQRALWEHYQSYERAAPDGAPTAAEPAVAAAPDPGQAPNGSGGMPSWLKSALLDAAAYHVAGPLGGIGRRAIAGYLKESPAAAATMQRAMTAIQAVTNHIDGAMRAFVGGVKRAAAVVPAGVPARAVTAATTRMVLGKSPTERRAALEARLAELSIPLMPDHISVPQPLLNHAPNVSGLMTARVGAIQSALIAAAPRVPSVNLSGVPNINLVSDADLRRFAAVDTALQDPLSVADGLAKGRLPHPAVLPAIQSAYPGLHARMQQAALAALVDTPNVRYATAIQLRLAFGLGGHATLAPQSVAMAQAAIQPPGSGGHGTAPAAHTSSASTPRSAGIKPETDILESR